ncbi:MAG: oligosaccharide flippase family protein [Phycisphaera sp.]|nr:oligosaccharide flippase family protein [Phycisphaera sp.]
MTTAGGLSRGATLLCQIIVGVFLTEREVGAYAVAVGITGFTCVLRSGGASHYLPTFRLDEYDGGIGRVFWWGFWFRILAALLTLAAALLIPALELVDPPPQLPEVLGVFALSQIVFAFSIVGRIRMAVRQRFTDLARLDIAVAALRVAATALLAWGGAGALALVIPIAMGPAVELLYYLANGTMRAIDYRWPKGALRETARAMLWPAAVSILISLNSQSNFLIVKPMLALASMGVFYFAYQIASQPLLAIATPLTNVLATYFAAQRGEREREAHAMISVASGAVLFASIVCFAIIALFPSVERMLWAGKWSEATLAVFALAGAGCWTTAVGLLGPALAGLRRFRAMASFEALKCLGIFSGAALSAGLLALDHRGALPFADLLRDAAAATAGQSTLVPASTSASSLHSFDSTIVGIATGVAVAVVSIGQLAWLLRSHDARITSTIRVLATGPLLSAAAAAASVAIGSLVAQALASGVPGLAGRSLALVEASSTGVLYLACAAAILRFLAADTLRETIVLLPARPQSLARRILRLA